MKQKEKVLIFEMETVCNKQTLFSLVLLNFVCYVNLKYIVYIRLKSEILFIITSLIEEILRCFNLYEKQ